MTPEPRAHWNPAVLEARCDSINLVCIGKFDRTYPLHLIIAAFAEYLHYATEPSRLMFAGLSAEIGFATQLKELATEQGIADAIDFDDNIDESGRRGLYCVADILLLAGDRDAWTHIAVEAAWLSVPIVSLEDNNSENSSCKDTPPGLRLTQTDPAELAATLRVIQRERGVRRRLLADQYHQLAQGHALPLRSWRVEGPFDSSYSLAIVNRELARALSRQGCLISLTTTPGSQEPSPDSNFLAHDTEIALLSKRGLESDWNDVILRNTYPPATTAMQGRIRVMQSYGWEETGFPHRYVAWFNRNLDLVTVVSRFVEKTLRDAGVRVPIAVVGNGADQLDTMAEGETLPQTLGNGFRFLHISSCFPRKGVDILLAAWGKAFRRNDPVTLIIKTFPNPHNDTPEQLAALRATDPDYPNVLLINEDWPQSRLLTLYRQCHAFVAPSRGEGFGLPFVEAMRFGLPLITTGWGGQTDFCSNDNAWLIDYKFAPTATHIDAGHSAWAEPDTDHLARLLQEVHCAPPHVLTARTHRASQTARRYTWDHVARLTRESISALDSMPQICNEPRIGWVSTWNSRCGIAAYSGYLASAIPPHRLQIFANHAADALGGDAPNVSRCWSAGHVDTLSAAIDEAQIDALVIQYHPAFFSPHNLATLLSAARNQGRQTHVFFHTTRIFERPEQRNAFLAQIPELQRATRLYVHGIADLNTFKHFDLLDNVTLFPHGIPAAPVIDRDKLRREKGLHGKTILASYGFLMPHKGQRQLVEALHHLLPENPNLHLLLCCALYPSSESHEEHRQLEECIRQLGLEQHVTQIHDYLPDHTSLEWLQLADLLVFAYQNTEESSSAAVRMGLAAGRPVVVTPLAIFADLGEAVHQLPGIGAPQIVAGLRQLLATPDILQARQDAAERYTRSRAWPMLSQRLLDLIDGLGNPLPQPPAP